MEGAAQVFEHVVAATVDDAGLDDRVVEPGSPDDLLGFPLRFVIARAASRAGAQEAQEDDFRNVVALRGFDHATRPFDVNARVGLSSDLPVDSGTVRHGGATLEG